MRELGEVAIVGAGQIGTLIGMTLRERSSQGLAGIGLLDQREGRSQAAVNRGAGDTVLDHPLRVLEADTIILAIPIRGILSWLRAWGPQLRPGSLLIDTGSSKGLVADTMSQCVPPMVHAIGGHPICGNQGSGPDAAEPGSLSGSSFALTPVRSDPTAQLWATELVEALDARPIVVDPQLHDRILARSSHLLHLLSAALVELANDQQITSELWRQLVGPAFRGMTRLAASDPEMVSGFLESNSAETLAAVGELIEQLESLAAMTPRPDQLRPVLGEIAIRRAELLGAGQ